MGNTIRILWSGITGRVGMEAVEATHSRKDIIIAGGLSLRDRFEHSDIEDKLTHLSVWTGYGNYNKIGSWVESLSAFIKTLDIDIIIDFSHPDVFGRVVELALYTGKPLISGTSGINGYQMKQLRDAAKVIPIFRGGNFRFKVKKFIDEAVELAKLESGNVVLYEDFYQGKSLPSETSKVIRDKIKDATSQTIEVFSSSSLDRASLICDWRVCVKNNPQKAVHCRTIGFDELAHDVLEIAKVMAKKPAKSELYDLDDIWPELKP